MIPPALAAPFMGVFGDRFPRKLVMLGANICGSLALALGVAALLFVDGPLWLVYVLVSAIPPSVAATAFGPAQAALLPSLTRTPDELTASNAVSSTVESVMSSVGPAVAGVLVAAASVETAFLVAATLTFAWVDHARSSGSASRGGHDTGERRSPPPGRHPLRACGRRPDARPRHCRVGLLVGLVGAQVVVSGALIVLLTGVAFEVLARLRRLRLGRLLSALGVAGCSDLCGCARAQRRPV